MDEDTARAGRYFCFVGKKQGQQQRRNAGVLPLRLRSGSVVQAKTDNGKITDNGKSNDYSNSKADPYGMTSKNGKSKYNCNCDCGVSWPG
jgi:hypothetical protein